MKKLITTLAMAALAATAMAQTGTTEQRQGAAQGASDARTSRGADANPHRQQNPSSDAGADSNRTQATGGGSNADGNRAAETGGTTDAGRSEARQSTTSERMDGDRTGTRDQSMVGSGRSDQMIRARDLINAPVHNPQGDRIGSIREIYLDENSGRIFFAAVDAGSWAEMDNDIVLCSWQSIRKDKAAGRQNAGTNRSATQGTTSPGSSDRATNNQEMANDRRDQGTGEHAFTVSMDREAIRKAPSVDDLKKVDNNWLRGAADKANVEGVENIKLVRGSEIRGQNLFDRDMNRIGQVEAITVDPQAGEVTHAVVRIDDAPDDNRNLTAVPFKMVRERSDETPGYVIQVDRSRINSMQFFEANNWPDFADPAWSREVTANQVPEANL
ncbi:MAG: PRC-barrel domain-containing protein [Terrimicrobiaceae bacterium]|nr:PRC-barrel domain-containing protein [Terrimicrobiaceae bacterium]